MHTPSFAASNTCSLPASVTCAARPCAAACAVSSRPRSDAHSERSASTSRVGAALGHARRDAIGRGGGGSGQSIHAQAALVTAIALVRSSLHRLIIADQGRSRPVGRRPWRATRFRRTQGTQLLELPLECPQDVTAGDGLKKFTTAGEARAEGGSSIAIEQTSRIWQPAGLANLSITGVGF